MRFSIRTVFHRLCLRFSLRTLGIVITLICVYFGPCWKATERWGAVERPEIRRIFDGGNGTQGVYIREDYDPIYSPLPFVVVRRVVEIEMGTGPKVRDLDRRYIGYYFWFFGLTFKLFDTPWPEDLGNYE
jgi:hypothetical protein